MIKRRFMRDVMKHYLKKYKVEKAQALVDLSEQYSQYCCIEMRMMFYAQTCPNTWDIHMNDLAKYYSDWNINGPYKFEWWAGLFFVDLVKFQIEFNDEYLSTLEYLAELTAVHKNKA